MRSLTVDLDGPVHYADYGGEGDPAIVLVHGLGGAHINWAAVGPDLAALSRVIAPDLAGFGRTPSGDRGTSLDANRELLDRFLDAVADPPAILIGNSMGGLTSMLEAAAEPEKVAALVLLDPALPQWIDAIDPLVAQLFLMYGTPGVGEALVGAMLQSMGPAALVRENFALICADVSRVREELIQQHIDLYEELAEGPDAVTGFLASARSLTEALQRPGFVKEAAEAVRAPTLVIHGALDRLVSVVAAEALVGIRPDWKLVVLDGVGHVPMLEDPDRVVEIVTSWLGEEGILEPVAGPLKEPA